MKALLRILAGAALLGTSPGAHAQLEGTLFTQPEERAYLDYLRDEFLRNNAERGFDIEEAAIPVIPTDEVAAPAGPIEFSFGGIMTRRDGSRSLWLNGAVLAERDLPAGMSLVGADRGTSLRIAHEGRTYVLRPGQTVDLVAGKVMESYQRTQAAPAVEGEALPEPVQDDAANAAPEPNAATDAAGTAAENTTTIDAVAAAVGALDNAQLDALLEALENQRLARQAEEDEADEPDDAP